MKTGFARALGAAAAMAVLPALAHPHVSVTVRSEIAYAADGKVSGVRHAWTFDPAYSAFVTQGLDKNNDGVFSPDELQELAKENTESLGDFEYFTVLKNDGAKQVFDPPRNPAMAFDKGEATLTFELPLKAPAPVKKALSLEVYDPSYFVAFALAPGEDAVRLAGAPKGCALTVTRPKPVDATQTQKLSETFFEALTASSNFGSNFANRALVACP
ncbi:MAG: COGs COG3683 [uncultured Microvirga sp.]|uniref:COGs COG3683 n=1 Tax=uncultured Microvirga sp. TaxID=412392 RepID=A0A6J4KTF9_9HYPH|nr:MAG: COGs COG3683 [uncultured Microvirga sp.]